jgi:conjugative relaxase-like TrwC/TraI family protein|tara:strand:+ start:3308 stop:6868 length:3561 start_codon:yes stop_codon:yes gene_type:complete
MGMISFAKCKAGEQGFDYFANDAVASLKEEYHLMGVDDADAMKARWSVTGDWSVPEGSRTDSIPPVEQNQEIDTYSLRKIAAGINPATDEAMTQNAKRDLNRKLAGDRGSRLHQAGFDLTFSDSKEMSVRWALTWKMPDQERAQALRDRLDETRREAVRRTLEWGLQNGAFCTRRGAGGKATKASRLEPVKAITTGHFIHRVNREAEPQVHEHVAVANFALRHDGTTGALDSHSIITALPAMNAIYRTIEAELLAEQMGISSTIDPENERNTRQLTGDDEVDAQLLGLADTWSSRSKQIAQAMADYERRNGRKLDPSQPGDAKIIDDIVKTTRRRKSDEHDVSHNLQRWSDDIEAAGIDANAIMDKLFPSDPVHLPELSEDELIDACKAALDRAGRDKLRVTRRDIERHVGEVLQGRAKLADVQRGIAMIFDGRHPEISLVSAGFEKGRELYATQAHVEGERAMYRLAIEGVGNASPISRRTVGDAIADLETRIRQESGNPNASLSAEQKAAVEWSCRNDAIVIAEGSAGAGKSTVSAATVAAHKQAGYHVEGVAIAYGAADIIRHETGIEEATSLSAWISTHQKPGDWLTRKTALLVDEAGMVGSDQMADLFEIQQRMAEVGGELKLILTGDTDQLPPVSAGQPMAALRAAIGAARVEEIRRQKVDWMREASTALADRRPKQALKEYDERGHIEWNEDGEDVTRTSLVEEWISDYRASGSRISERSLVIADTHPDVRALNEQIRAGLKAAGGLSGPEIRLTTIAKGSEPGATAERSFQAGDAIRFGENFVVRQGDEKPVTIRNNDTARILKISGSGLAAQITIELEKSGKRVTARFSDLVDQRRFATKPGDRLHPKIEHAYAGTGYASQGQSVRKSLVYLGTPTALNSGSLYVNFTRHKEDMRVFVDCEGFRKSLRQTEQGLGENRFIALRRVKELLIAKASKAPPSGNLVDGMSQEEIVEFAAGLRDVGEVEEGARPPLTEDERKSQIFVRLGILDESRQRGLGELWQKARKISEDRAKRDADAIADSIVKKAKAYTPDPKVDIDDFIKQIRQDVFVVGKWAKENIDRAELQRLTRLKATEFLQESGKAAEAQDGKLVATEEDKKFIADQVRRSLGLKEEYRDEGWVAARHEGDDVSKPVHGGLKLFQLRLAERQRREEAERLTREEAERRDPPAPGGPGGGMP